MNRPYRIAMTIFFGAAFCLAGGAAAADANPSPQVYQCDPEAMGLLSEHARDKDPAVAEAVERLRKEADKLLTQGPWSVTYKKPPSPSGDPHDYISLAPYFWPNPDTKDGLPYVRHDGKRNPEIKGYDAGPMGSMAGASYTLALAFYLTEDDRYADRAAMILRIWFLDVATRMNPNLEHGQMVKGTNDGRGTGIIETNRLLEVVDAVGLLKASGAWTDADQKGMEKWFADYVHWMRQSKRGRSEAAAANNHGMWYDVQAATYLLFIHDDAAAKEVLESSKKRIASQVKPDGSLPLELARTNSWSYSIFDLKAMTQLAGLGQQARVDLWNYKAPDGAGIRAVIDNLLPYATGEKKWEHQQISGFDGATVIGPLRRAAAAYPERAYEQAIARIKPRGNAFDLEDLRTPLERE